MKIAAYITTVLFVLTAITSITALVAGISSGVVQINGWEMTVAWNGSGGAVEMGGDPVLHQHYFYVTAPVYVVAVIGVLPLVLLGILTPVLFGRSSSKDSG